MRPSRILFATLYRIGIIHDPIESKVKQSTKKYIMIYWFIIRGSVPTRDPWGIEIIFIVFLLCCTTLPREVSARCARGM